MNRYTVSEQYAALATAKNLFTITAPSTHYVILTHASITNETIETAEQLGVGFYRATAAGTGTPTSVTPQPCELGNATASVVTATHSYATTEPTLHTEAHYLSGMSTVPGWGWSSQNGMALVIPPSGICVLRIVTATFTAFACVAEVTWRELLTADYSDYAKYG